LEKECDRVRAESNSKGSQHRKEISDKNDKIQELMDELLEKDTLIDNQAVLNKNLQKKLDHLNDL
jgi:predicted RNase H-like nuclease (RuvC/YqgF family)